MTAEVAATRPEAMNTVATHQVMKPCAVSREKTSWVCVPTQRVRSRPAM
jgi:hypothetical protein